MEFQPVALPCGHSMCHQCCEEQLTKCNGNTVAARRKARHQTVSMGVGVISRQKRQKNSRLQKTLSIIKETDNNENRTRPFYLSPPCPVCHTGPKFVSILYINEFVNWNIFSNLQFLIMLLKNF